MIIITENPKFGNNDHKYGKYFLAEEAPKKPSRKARRHRYITIKPSNRRFDFTSLIEDEIDDENITDDYPVDDTQEDYPTDNTDDNYPTEDDEYPIDDIEDYPSDTETLYTADDYPTNDEEYPNDATDDYPTDDTDVDNTYPTDDVGTTTDDAYPGEVPEDADDYPDGATGDDIPGDDYPNNNSYPTDDNVDTYPVDDTQEDYPTDNTATPDASTANAPTEPATTEPTENYPTDDAAAATTPPTDYPGDPATTTPATTDQNAATPPVEGDATNPDAADNGPISPDNAAGVANTDNTDYTDGAGDADAPTDTPDQGGQETKKVGIGYDSMRKYKLFESFEDLLTSINNYKEKLSNVIVDDIEINKMLKTFVNNLSDIYNLCYDFMIIKFDAASYVQARTFYETLLATIYMIFDAIDKNIFKEIKKNSKNDKNNSK